MPMDSPIKRKEKLISRTRNTQFTGSHKMDKLVSQVEAGGPGKSSLSNMVKKSPFAHMV